ncbi:NUDIX domain-containing protein [Bosea sp. BK604]|uniref:NUDIX domain-containing protein n=1 Tax=Bosea sp. BK604 TaxID=2512180 RepID=UPI0010434864|nr:NUDIX domain-containing protein [Bosea sp. BK604]TCR69734.1 putative NUDIX family NTP pyrophosphohydrolase [Bosea sp. BK604]
MAATSAGLLLYRRSAEGPSILLVHPGGPFWKNKDGGAWSIPKGEIGDGEDPLAAAIREFQEELGTRPVGDFAPLGEVVQRAGKRVLAFAIEGDLDAAAIESNSFTLEWPPRSGRIAQFPEVDRADWFSLPVARKKILESQRPFLDRLEELVRV